MARKMDKVIITCAVTGGIHTPTMSDALPITPDEIAHTVDRGGRSRRLDHSPCTPATRKPASRPRTRMSSCSFCRASNNPPMPW